ncbi:hypothetical protein H6G74_04535 [Nostoc spongiaeforme FACHB-130]|uniref:Alpha/beta hydrolase n=1 Tax=Nostoc spongiaeforme FACHB-130 TaxID=1357510 RepID=A0ABR8FQU1_9NOSO|nr:hypothetical protein [Nostoc spongiaeforme]MBD2593597.1 hypothetical protein [Nostoc spongiaeforme FACHB-130]
MRKIGEQILLWLQNGTLKLLVLAGIILLTWGTFAPVGTLVWWLRQNSESLGIKKNLTKNVPSDSRKLKVDKSRNIDCYIVFLPGVGDFSANQLTSGEEFFLNKLEQIHPNCVTVRDVFPYSAANESLGGRRLLAPLWNAAEKADGWLSNSDVLIKIRNLWRFAISADNRYGHIYNLGIANAIVDRMNAVYPVPKNPQQKIKLILVGTSGGVQVALGAATYLDQWLNAQLIVVSIGGDFDGENGFDKVDDVYQLVGSRDWIEDISKIVFASRWPITVGSPFNQARRQGRYQVLQTGPHAHSGSQGYFGTTTIGQSQTTYVELTLQKVNQLPIWSNQNPPQ